MNRYVPSKLTKETLKPWLEKLGVDYAMFVKLDGAGLNNTALSQALSIDREHPISVKTIKHWRKVRVEE